MRSIPFGKPIVGAAEKDAVISVLDSGILAHGKKIGEFEDAFASFTNAPYAVSVANCTAGMHLLYIALGIGEGDEVIVAAQTHVATAHAVELAGAKPIFVDAENGTGNIDCNRIESAVTERTRAIAVVHFLGVPLDMAKLMSIANEHNLRVIEDCALAIGSRFDKTHVGLHGDAGAFSFYPVKHITTAEGGMVITRDESLAKEISRKRAFGMDRHFGQRTMPGIYDVPGLGFNYRMNEVEAAIGVEQMKRLPGFLQKRRKNALHLYELLEGVDGVEFLSSENDRSESSYYCASIILGESHGNHRPQIVNELRSRGVGTSVYYPHPVPRMTYYKKKYGYNAGDYPAAERISDRSIALPVGPHVEIDDINYIADAVRSIIQEMK